MLRANAMTIGQLARRSGVSIKVLRQYEGLGLVYTLGRSESNYRLFGEEALWCVQVIGNLRSLGLTLKEIQEICAFYCERPSEPIGPQLGEKLNRALNRIETRMAELWAIRQRINDFQTEHAAALAGHADLELYASDPRRVTVEIAS
jgi:MerR family copper efflux transcriptional regulator